MSARDTVARWLMKNAVRVAGSEERVANLANTMLVMGIPPRGGSGRRALPVVTSKTALTNSVVWACKRIRADLISTFPIDTYRDVGGIAVEVPPAPILVEPDGSEWPMHHWMWASQWDLDGVGNTVGRIVEKNALGLPSRIELADASTVSIRKLGRQDTYKYRIDGVEYDPSQVWHDRQFPIPGLPVGLSPTMFAAAEISGALSFQQFALDWFAGGGMPKAHLKNTKRALDTAPTAQGQDSNESRRVKDRYMATVTNGDIFVSGNDWELDFLQAKEMGTEWLQGQEASIPALCRYFGCPVDLVEAAISSTGSSNINYTNGLQRNLQFLTYHLQPVVYRREKSLSALLPRPRYVKMNTNSLLRLDPLTATQIISAKLKDRVLTNTEARALDEKPALTEADIAEFATVYGTRATPPADATSSDAAATRNLFGGEWVSPMSAIPYDTTGVHR